MDFFEKTLPSLCKFYSLHSLPFALYLEIQNLVKDIIEKADKLTSDQFQRFDFNYMVFNGISKKTGLHYKHYIKLWTPSYCDCFTF